MPQFSTITYIYALVDPTDGVIRYVGKSDHPALRLRGHLRLSGDEWPKNAWLRELASAGLQPVLKILEVVSEERWQPAERQWIASLPALLNIHAGGRGAIRSNPSRSPGSCLYICEECGRHFSLAYYRPGQPRFCGWACRFGSRFGKQFTDLIERTDECWNWTGPRNKNGYGTFGQQQGGKRRTRLAHRVCYEMLVGPIPKGFVLDHLCRKRACVNPAHLEPVTQLENMRRGYFATKTHCPKGHPYDEFNTVHRKGGGRKCRECRRISNQTIDARRKLERATRKEHRSS